ncbi:NAD(P)/FAD-dependent oxidoreductase [Clostridium psychrophilum]|uniref:NAD(P)/FAD-dependent oxidoreductase n=1 Tax=Clostridium psychrophilum TaxID=132926 RepID=UPI001C0BE521|nr:FAD-dependent oxidoreductase [Clostridium psychrophilum]MBU3180822.1 FAD-dependent oxidoreductase [Clostridium psychrophilum]
MKIFIVGGGFAGINAAKELSKRLSNSHEIFLINKHGYTTMLPNLPEIVSDRLTENDITENITNLIPPSVKFLKEDITSVDLDEKIIHTKDNKYMYDYLVLALGSRTNFLNFNQNLEKVNVLDSLASAENVRKRFLDHVKEKEEVNLVISGAGFTGIELACNLYELCKKRGKKINVTIVELGKKLLPMLSEKSRTHVLKKFDKLKFNISLENEIKIFDGKNIVLKNGEVIKDVFFCWCSGVKTSLKPVGLYDTLSDGRIIVNKFLSIPKYPQVYVAGDAAAIKDKNDHMLRRAVNFAELSGKNAGKNIALHIEGKEMESFTPVDLGWIIPIYITSVGVSLGRNVRGRKGIFMHYMICGIKNYSFRNFGKEFIAAIKYTFVKAK